MQELQNYSSWGEYHHLKGNWFFLTLKSQEKSGENMVAA
jgi:hypothetical protein